jgi:hypothetical protein
MTAIKEQDTVEMLTHALMETTWFLANNIKNNLKRTHCAPHLIPFEVRNSPPVAHACDVLAVVLGREFDPMGEKP